MSVLGRRDAVVVFLAFAFTYFFSALLRAITATLSPTLTAEFALSAQELGLLAGGFFIGFAATQLPLGSWLDRYGPRRVTLGFLVVAVLGCVAFSLAHSFAALLAARILCGVGVSACLMAPLTGFRSWLHPPAQLRANSWMLMTGSFGMVASTLPVQWIVPSLGWRPVFWGLAACLVASMAAIAWKVPDVLQPVPGQPAAPVTYAQVWRDAYFRRMAPVAFFSYGGMIAIQSLWAGPWMVRVAGYTPLQAAGGLFFVNACMLCTFWTWGLVNPTLARRGIRAERLIAWGLPISFVVLLAIIVAGPSAGAAAWAAFCVSSTFVALAQPAVGLAFAPALAGRALSAFNLVIFGGVFVLQWGIGLLVDAFLALGASELSAFRGAMGLFLGCAVVAYGFFVRPAR